MNPKSDVEYVLDFCVDLSRRMLVAGANLERVQLAMARICHAYHLTDMSLFLLSTHISISARNAEGEYASRQASIPSTGIHLDRLKKLNRLSYQVANDHPDPEQLAELLDEASKTEEYKDWIILLAQLSAMGCLCLIFGGGLRELIPVWIVTAIMHYSMDMLSRPGLDRIVTNAITMLIATIVAIIMMGIGISSNGPVIIITVSMLVIPGIPLVNAVRNLLCGNEMNGILQILKVVIETLALAMGIYLALWMFSLREGMQAAVVTSLSNPVILLILSYVASVSFGVVFRIPAHDLWRAGLGGVLTRLVLIILPQFITTRLVYVTLAAMVADLYAEMMAAHRKDPSTYFVYPAIVPLIPGDLFYYSLAGLYIGDMSMLNTNGINCLLTLLGMSIGFVLGSTIAHYIRKMQHVRFVNGQTAFRLFRKR